MTDPDTPLPWRHPLRIAELATRKPTRFDLVADKDTRAAIAEWAEITAVSALRLKGELTPKGRRDWHLSAALTAQVEQACVVTLAPVRTTVSEQVERQYLADMPDPEGDEIEMPEDDTIEALPAVVDLGAVALEAFELALPLYPRAEGAEFGDTAVTEPGARPMTDDDARPFANLRAIIDGQKPDDKKSGE